MYTNNTIHSPDPVPPAMLWNITTPMKQSHCSATLLTASLTLSTIPPPAAFFGPFCLPLLYPQAQNNSEIYTKYWACKACFFLSKGVAYGEWLSFLHVGQCGIQLGRSFWDTALEWDQDFDKAVHKHLKRSECSIHAILFTQRWYPTMCCSRQWTQTSCLLFWS